MRPRIEFKDINRNKAIAIGVCWTENEHYFIWADNGFSKDDADTEFYILQELQGHLEQLVDMHHKRFLERNKGRVYKIQVQGEEDGKI